MFTEQRVCPMHADWPDVNTCLNPEYQCRLAWPALLGEGETLTEAIERTESQRRAIWAWQLTPPMPMPQVLRILSPNPVTDAAEPAPHAEARSRTRAPRTRPAPKGKGKSMGKGDRQGQAPAQFTRSERELCPEFGKGGCASSGPMP